MTFSCLFFSFLRAKHTFNVILRRFPNNINNSKWFDKWWLKVCDTTHRIKCTLYNTIACAHLIRLPFSHINRNRSFQIPKRKTNSNFKTMWHRKSFVETHSFGKWFCLRLLSLCVCHEQREHEWNGMIQLPFCRLAGKLFKQNSNKLFINDKMNMHCTFF